MRSVDRPWRIAGLTVADRPTHRGASPAHRGAPPDSPRRIAGLTAADRPTRRAGSPDSPCADRPTHRGETPDSPSESPTRRGETRTRRGGTHRGSEAGGAVTPTGGHAGGGGLAARGLGRPDHRDGLGRRGARGRARRHALPVLLGATVTRAAATRGRRLRRARPGRDAAPARRRPPPRSCRTCCAASTARPSPSRAPGSCSCCSASGSARPRRTAARWARWARPSCGRSRSPSPRAAASCSPRAARRPCSSAPRCAPATRTGCRSGSCWSRPCWGAGPGRTGHAGTSADHQLAVVTVALHVAAAALWVGGLGAVLVVAGPRRRLLDAVLPRFSTLAGGCLACVVVSGVLERRAAGLLRPRR